MNKVIILYSGTGSNFKAIIDKTDSSKINIIAAITDVFDAPANDIAKDNNIPVHIIDYRKINDKATFRSELLETTLALNPDWIILAGFMRILNEDFINKFYGKIVNIHPSLLPKFKGLNTHKRAIESGESEHGTSVHFVNNELDGGPLIAQVKINIADTDTPALLTTKVKCQEHYIYPKVVSWLTSGRLKLEYNIAYLDEQPLPKTGIMYPAVEFDSV